MQIWMSNGAQLAWLIDPIRKLAIVYRADREPETLRRPEVLEGEGPVAGFRLEMARVLGLELQRGLRHGIVVARPSAPD